MKQKLIVKGHDLHRGYIKLYRRITDNPLWLKEPFTDGQAWVDLILLANYRQGMIHKRGLRIEINRGQIGYSELSLCDRWKWSRGKVRRFFKFLEQKNMIKKGQKPTSVSPCFEIINYEQYQGNDTEELTYNDTEDGQKTDRRRTEDGTGTIKIRRIKKDKKDKKEVSEIVLPEWIDPVLWQAWKDKRKEIKKPLSGKAEELAIEKLAKLRDEGSDPSEVLKESITNSWQGLFPLKDQRGSGKKFETVEEHNARVFKEAGIV